MQIQITIDSLGILSKYYFFFQMHNGFCAQISTTVYINFSLKIQRTGTDIILSHDRPAGQWSCIHLSGGMLGWLVLLSAPLLFLCFLVSNFLFQIFCTQMMWLTTIVAVHVHFILVKYNPSLQHSCLQSIILWLHITMLYSSIKLYSCSSLAF